MSEQTEIQQEGSDVAIYHNVRPQEGFEETAQILLRLLQRAQETNPGKPRHLYLDIEEHKNSEGGYDADMFELQTKFIMEFLMQFLTSARVPLLEDRGVLRNPKGQLDEIPSSLNIQQA